MLKSRTTKSHTPKRSVSTRSCRLANWIILEKKEARKEARVFEIGKGLDGSTVRELRWMIKNNQAVHVRNRVSSLGLPLDEYWIALGKKEARKVARVFEVGKGLDGSTV